MNKFASFAVLALVAACGGSGTGNVDMGGTAPTLAELTDRANAADVLGTKISNYSPTSTANVPTSGTSTFRGPAALLIERGAVNYYMIGDSTLTMDFDKNAMSGNAKNFEGGTGSDRLFAASGQVNYTSGRIGTGLETGLFTTNYNGTLGVLGDTINIRGTALGNFQGNRVTGAIRTKAIQAVDGTPGSDVDLAGLPASMTATVNGKSAIGLFVMAGEN